MTSIPPTNPGRKTSETTSKPIERPMIENNRQQHREWFSKLSLSRRKNQISQQQQQQQQQQHHQSNRGNSSSTSINPYIRSSSSTRNDRNNLHSYTNSNNANDSVKKNSIYCGFEYGIQPDGSSLAETLWEQQLGNQNQEETHLNSLSSGRIRTRPQANDSDATTTSCQFQNLMLSSW